MDPTFLQKIDPPSGNLDSLGHCIKVKNLNVSFGKNHILKNISAHFPQREIIALIGTSGCGKSTFLRTFNRMHDLVDDAKVSGYVEVLGQNIYSTNIDVYQLRRRVGMVFQKANPFPKSIFENIAFGLRLVQYHKSEINDRVESALRKSYLWDEVCHQLNQPALKLSGGQQQRLCIARAIAIEPEILLMDEPCSALDPISTQKIEELVLQLKKDYSVVIVTHNLQQAKRIADKTAFLHLGELLEFNSSRNLFENPSHELTKNYVKGYFG